MVGAEWRDRPHRRFRHHHEFAERVHKALGLLVGIDLVFGGGALIAMGLAACKTIVQPSIDPHPEKVAAVRTPT
jgi:hypothetical protein